MAINVSQAFHRTSANPVDETMALTKAQMLTVNDNLMPAKYITICQDDGCIYLYDKTATPSVETGKFTKLETGSTITIDSELSDSSENPVQNKIVKGAIDNKVDKNGTDRLMTADEGIKLSGIETGAEVNVQSDWNQIDTEADDFIKNKPTMGTAAEKDSTNAVTSGSTDLVESGAVKTAIDSAIASVYHPSGDITCAELVAGLLIAANEGNVYNTTDSGTTTADFKEGAGKPIYAGDEVAIVKVGSAYKFNKMTGFIDLSNYVQKSLTTGLVKNDGTIDTTQYISDISGKADLTDLASTFSTTTVYTIGQYVTYNGDLYRCIAAHSAGAWNASHFEAVIVGNELNTKLNINNAQYKYYRQIYVENPSSAPYYLIYERSLSAISYKTPITLKGIIGRAANVEKATLDIEVDFRVSPNIVIRGIVSSDISDVVDIIPTWDSTTDTARIYIQLKKSYALVDLYSNNVIPTNTGEASMSGTEGTSMYNQGVTIAYKNDIFKTQTFSNIGSAGSTNKYIELSNAYPSTTVQENIYLITGRAGESAFIILPTKTQDYAPETPKLIYLSRSIANPIVSAAYDSNLKLYIEIGKYTVVTVSQIGGIRANWSAQILNELPSEAIITTEINNVQTDTDVQDRIKETVGQTGRNLYNKATGKASTVVSQNGESTSSTYSNFNASDYIEVEPNTSYYLQNGCGNTTQNTSCIYDSSKTFLRYAQLSGSSVQNGIINTGADAKYIRLNVLASYVDTCMLSKGFDTNVAYEPYHKNVEDSKADKTSVYKSVIVDASTLGSKVNYIPLNNVYSTTDLITSVYLITNRNGGSSLLFLGTRSGTGKSVPYLLRLNKNDSEVTDVYYNTLTGAIELQFNTTAYASNLTITQIGGPRCDFSVGTIAATTELTDHVSIVSYAKTTDTTVTLAAANWVGTSAPYTQEVSVIGITSTDKPILDVSVSDIVATGLAQIEDQAKITKAITGSGTITFSCYEEKPTNDLTVNVKVVK